MLKLILLSTIRLDEYLIVKKNNYVSYAVLNLLVNYI